MASSRALGRPPHAPTGPPAKRARQFARRPRCIPLVCPRQLCGGTIAHHACAAPPKRLGRRRQLGSCAAGKCDFDIGRSPPVARAASRRRRRRPQLKGRVSSGGRSPSAGGGDRTTPSMELHRERAPSMRPRCSPRGRLAARARARPSAGASGRRDPRRSACFEGRWPPRASARRARRAAARAPERCRVACASAARGGRRRRRRGRHRTPSSHTLSRRGAAPKPAETPPGAHEDGGAATRIVKRHVSMTTRQFGRRIAHAETPSPRRAHARRRLRRARRAATAAAAAAPTAGRSPADGDGGGGGGGARGLGAAALAASVRRFDGPPPRRPAGSACDGCRGRT